MNFWSARRFLVLALVPRDHVFGRRSGARDGVALEPRGGGAKGSATAAVQISRRRVTVADRGRGRRACDGTGRKRKAARRTRIWINRVDAGRTKRLWRLGPRLLPAGTEQGQREASCVSRCASSPAAATATCCCPSPVVARSEASLGHGRRARGEAPARRACRAARAARAEEACAANVLNVPRKREVGRDLKGSHLPVRRAEAACCKLTGCTVRKRGRAVSSRARCCARRRACRACRAHSRRRLLVASLESPAAAGVAEGVGPR